MRSRHSDRCEQESNMIGRSIVGTACAFACALDAPLAQSVSTEPAAIEEWAHDVTVLTMAPDGWWGTATTLERTPETRAVPAHDPQRAGAVASFAFGHVEFDRDPAAPGGVPGFDAWPPNGRHE
jgi:hypothetical protein